MGYSVSDVKTEVEGAFEIPGTNRVVVSLRANMAPGLLTKIKQFVHNAVQREAHRFPLEEGMTGWWTKIETCEITRQNGREVQEITVVIDVRQAFQVQDGDVEITVGQGKVIKEEGAGGG